MRLFYNKFLSVIKDDFYEDKDFVNEIVRKTLIAVERKCQKRTDDEMDDELNNNLTNFLE